MSKQRALNAIICIVKDAEWLLPRTVKERFRLLTGKDIDLSSVKARLRELRGKPHYCTVDKRPHFKGSRELEYRVTGLSADSRSPSAPQARKAPGLDGNTRDCIAWAREKIEQGLMSRAEVIEKLGSQYEQLIPRATNAGPERRQAQPEPKPVRGDAVRSPSPPSGEAPPARRSFEQSGLPRGDL